MSSGQKNEMDEFEEYRTTSPRLKAAQEKIPEIESLREKLHSVPLQYLSINDIKYITESCQGSKIEFYSNERLIKLRQLFSQANRFYD